VPFIERPARIDLGQAAAGWRINTLTPAASTPGPGSSQYTRAKVARPQYASALSADNHFIHQKTWTILL
jgi:hypothetical protein